MSVATSRSLSDRLRARAKTGALGIRGVLFAGRRHRCPVCDGSVRAFADQWSLLRTAPAGYCPRCNVKARHRRVWRHLEQHADLGGDHHVVLEVAPWPGLARALRRTPHVDHHGVDLEPAADCADVGGDVTALPFRTGSIDLALCIHVLEHVTDDRAAIAELHRCLRTGGLAVVSVPLDLERPTDEDPSVTDPEERKLRFGERGHVRAYGLDLADRLRSAGFEVSLHRETDLDQDERRRYGLKGDEHIFHCIKPA